MNTKLHLLTAAIFASLLIVPWNDRSGHESAKFQQPNSPDSSFYIIGNKPDFELLRLAVSNPDDVTNNQRRGLIMWIDRKFLLPKDSTK